jgi:hypothetical protein
MQAKMRPASLMSSGAPYRRVEHGQRAAGRRIDVPSSPTGRQGSSC